jgi:hypothetical protein
VTPSDDKYLVQLRRELTRSQARLAKAEQQRDRLAKENLELRQRLNRKIAAGSTAPAKRER